MVFFIRKINEKVHYHGIKLKGISVNRDTFMSIGNVTKANHSEGIKVMYDYWLMQLSPARGRLPPYMLTSFRFCVRCSLAPRGDGYDCPGEEVEYANLDAA